MYLNVPVLGIRMDIDKVGGIQYGFECWKIIWGAISPANLKNSQLYEGDTAKTLNGGQERVYCIAIQSSDARALKGARDALARSKRFSGAAAYPPFAEYDELVAEPLLDAGTIDGSGLIGGEAYLSLPAFEEVNASS